MTEETIFGYIERITFQNPENGYTIAQLQIKGCRTLTCIVGSMPGLSPGETVRCTGIWKQHLVHGKQFIVSQCKSEAPADLVGIKKYLGSGLIKGIGSKYAARIVEKFGIETLNIIDKAPERLIEVEGIGSKRIGLIKECWDGQRSIRDVMIFLQANGVSPAYAQKIFKVYGQQAIEKVKESPFYLARDISGIGFKIADKIASKMGISKESSHRIDAGIEYVLESLANEGHVCFPQNELIEAAEKILEIPSEIILGRLSTLNKEHRIELFELAHEGVLKNFVWLRALFAAETGIAREIKRILNKSSLFREIDINKALAWAQSTLGIQLAENQSKAVSRSLSDKMHIITGGPGTGKSTITKAILAIMSKLTEKIILAAPTGRAAKRMTEITGRKAATIHSLLEFDFSKRAFKRNKDNPLDCDLMIVDEASMIDTYLMYSLLKAIPSHARVIFVGDIYQLPSVGPGNVLKDIINSQCFPVTMLTEIYRQAANSRIVTNAHRINNGIQPDLINIPNGDFFFIQTEEQEQGLAEIISLVSQRLPKKYGFNAFKDIQVLSPMRRGILGIDNLNISLQNILNPKGHSVFWSGCHWREGDKVMQIRNNYQKEVCNGDIGLIVSIDEQEQSMVVLMDEREIIYEFSELDELRLSYAVSVHKYQGSECPCIIFPIHQSHFILLTRNLFYTAVTRGKKLVILVGTKKAAAMAVNNDLVQKRYTGLQQALVGTFKIL